MEKITIELKKNQVKVIKSLKKQSMKTNTT